MSSSYGSRWPPTPAFIARLMSQDVYANPTDALTIIGGGGGGGSNSPPNFAPSVPSTVSAPAPSSIAVNFNVSSVGGVPRPTTWAQYSASSNGPEWVVLTSGPSSNNYIRAVADDLGYNNSYYFQSVASNSSGILSSAVVLFSTVATAPSPAPGVPARNGVPVTPSSISVTFVANTTGAPTPKFSTLYGTTNPPTSFWPVSLNAGTSNTYTATISSLTAGTNYYIASYAANPIGAVSSVAGLFSTTGGVNPLPNKAPVITFQSATKSTITFQLDPTGITGIPQPTVDVFWGLSTTSFNTGITLLASNPAVSTISSYTATYDGAPSNALLSSTNYFFKGLSGNAVGSVSNIQTFSTIAGSAPPAAPSTVSTILGIGFFTYETDYILDTSDNVNVGNWNPVTGTVSRAGGPAYLSTIQASNTQVVISLGGATANATVLSTMFGHPASYDTGAINLANSMAYAFFKGPAASNPLNFTSTAWAGFSFSGIDLDIEALTPSTTSLYVFASTLKANPGFAGKIITTAPQTPYLSQPANSGLNANGNFASFSEMNPGTNLNQAYTGSMGDQLSLLAPVGGNLVDYNFVQVYNNAVYSYPVGGPSSNWNNVMAGWGIQCLKSGYPNKHPKNIVAFATYDATPGPITDQDLDITAFNISVSTATSTIRSFSTVSGVLPYSSITAYDWCAGIGLWSATTDVNPPTSTNSVAVLSTFYCSPSTLNQIPTQYTMTYGAVANNSSYGIVAGSNMPVLNGRGY